MQLSHKTLPGRSMQWCLRQIPVLVLSSTIVLLLGLLQATTIQAQTLDLQPPTLQLEEIGRGIAGEIQVFTATVSDEQGLTNVILYHRLSGDTRYASTEMLAIPGTDIYSASVATTAEDPRDIEYYLQAEDTGGNKAIKGFAFDPLLRDITADVVATAATTTTPSIGLSRNRKILYGALGVLALGLIASQANGGSSSSSGTAPNNPVDLEVNPL